jgi:hypothetical protein
MFGTSLSYTSVQVFDWLHFFTLSEFSRIQNASKTSCLIESSQGYGKVEWVRGRRRFDSTSSANFCKRNETLLIQPLLM